MPIALQPPKRNPSVGKFLPHPGARALELIRRGIGNQSVSRRIDHEKARADIGRNGLAALFKTAPIAAMQAANSDVAFEPGARIFGPRKEFIIRARFLEALEREVQMSAILPGGSVNWIDGNSPVETGKRFAAPVEL